MTARLPALLALGCLGLVSSGAAPAASPVAPRASATARGIAALILGPDQTVIASTTEASAPPSATQLPSSFAYPADGSILSAASADVTVSASAVDGTAAVESEVTRLSLFNGEITADAVRASVTSAATIGDLSDSTVTNLVVLGASMPAPPNTRIALADWGSAVLLGESIDVGAAAPPSWRGTVSGLVIQLNSDHGGLAAGSEIRIGFAEAYARPPAVSSAVTRKPEPPQGSPPGSAASLEQAAKAARARVALRGYGHLGQGKARGRAPLLLTLPNVTPKLTGGGYVFPVSGPSAYGDTFGELRGDVAGSWHHGDDIFAPLGAPVLAVADGTVFSAGWNDVGGYRFWLRDRAGNEFYYAHLSAFTTLAVNGRHVRAGDVLAFVGNTGDAETTPFHLHFEVHPVSMLFLAYDGAVNPTPYLDGWKRIEDVRILPAVPFGLPGRAGSAPPAGAILLRQSDISTANGLDPASFKRAMSAMPVVDVTLSPVAELPVPLPVLDRA